LEFDGQNQTEAIVGWPKMDFFLRIISTTDVKDGTLHMYPGVSNHRLGMSARNFLDFFLFLNVTDQW
jgi:hypothetical protein